MSRRRALLLPIVGLVTLAFLVYHFLPKRYEVLERRTGTLVLWKGDDVLIFVDHNKLGRTNNVVQRTLGAMQHRPEYAGLLLFASSIESLGEDHSAFLVGQGSTRRLRLPSDFRPYGWRTLSGQLVNAPARGNASKWNGRDFVPLTTEEQHALNAAEVAENAKSAVVKSDDAVTEDDAESDLFAALKATGWHYKRLFPWMSPSHDTVLPIVTQSGTLTLTQKAAGANMRSDNGFAAYGRSGGLLLEGASFEPQGQQIAASLDGRWREVRRDEYLSMASGVPHRQAVSFSSFVWIVVLFVSLLRYSFVIDLLRIFGLKKRLVTNVASSYAVPPAIPDQFPGLDKTALESFTEQFEQLGFNQLGDYSLVPAGKALQIPVFLRLFTHPRYQCFAEIGQIFPRGQRPGKFGSALISSMEDGWKLGVSDRKPEAAGVFIRLPRSLSRSFPGITASELLKNFLEFRNQVCVDLGIRPLPNATLEEYIAQQQRSAIQRQVAIKNRSVTLGLARYYKRLFSFGRTKPVYEWLGEYPKVAAQRNSQWTAAAIMPTSR
jgi:hypothetical protein